MSAAYNTVINESHSKMTKKKQVADPSFGMSKFNIYDHNACEANACHIQVCVQQCCIIICCVLLSLASFSPFSFWTTLQCFGQIIVIVISCVI